MIYADSAQDTALRLVARKRRAAKLIDGDLDEDGLVAQAEMDGLLKELARSLVDEDAAAAVESAAELLAQARTDELADTELIVDALPPDDDGVAAVGDAAAQAPATSCAEPSAAAGTTMSLFDYMAAHPPVSRKGKKARATVPSAQLVLFDLFDKQVVEPEVTLAPADTEMRQLDLFSGAAWGGR
jgi:hypothetical protein